MRGRKFIHVKPLVLLFTISILFFGNRFPSQAIDFDIKVSNFTGSGGSGSTDGDSKNAQFLWVRDLATNSKGEILALDNIGLRKIDTNDQVSTIWRIPNIGQSFCALAIDRTDVNWLVDCNGTQVARVSPEGQLLNSFAILPSGTYSWVKPGLAFLPSGNMLFASYYNAKIIEISPNGTIKDFLVGSNTTGCGNTPRLLGIICPISVAVSDSGKIYFVNQNAQNQWELAQIDSNKSVSIAVPADSQNGWSPFSIKNLNGQLWSLRLVQDATFNDSCQRKSSLNSISGSRFESKFSIQTFQDWELSFTMDRQGNFLLGSASGGNIRRVSSQGSELTTFGQTNLGCQDGNRMSAKFISPNGLAQDKNGVIVVKDQNSVRLIDQSGIVTTIFRSSYIPVGGGRLLGDEYYFLLENRLVSLNIKTKNITSRQTFINGQDYFAGGSTKSFDIDSQGNLYVIVARGNWSDRVLRKVTPTGQQNDLFGFGSGDASLYIDSKDNLLIAFNNNVKKYSLNNISSSTLVTNYNGYSPAFATDENDNLILFVSTMSSPGGATNTLSRISNSLQTLLISSTLGSTNSGRDSKFIQVADVLKLNSGDWLLADAGNHSLRLATFNEIPNLNNQNSNLPSQSPASDPNVPSQNNSSSPKPLPTKSTSQEITIKPKTPTISSVNFVQNKVNINVNISESEKPDKVFLVSPNLGITKTSPLVGTISGKSAYWLIDLGKLNSGALVPIEVFSEKDGVRSDSAQSTYQVPNVSSKSAIKNPPSSPKNFTSRIVGTSVFVSVEASNETTSLATGAHLFSKALGISKDNALQGDVVGNKGLIEIPIKPSMLGKQFPVTVYLTNTVGESKPLNALLKIPSSSKVSVVPTGVSSAKIPKTVICARLNQTRAFEGTTCPPGWEKR